MKRYLWLCSSQVENKPNMRKTCRNRESMVQWLRRFSYYCPGYYSIYHWVPYVAWNFLLLLGLLWTGGFVQFKIAGLEFALVWEQHQELWYLERLVTECSTPSLHWWKSVGKSVSWDIWTVLKLVTQVLFVRCGDVKIGEGNHKSLICYQMGLGSTYLSAKMPRV